MRRLVLFGSGTVAEKNLIKNPCFIVDNNKDLHGSKFKGVQIFSPEVIRNKSEEFFVIICTTSIDAVVPQLTDLGYMMQRDAQVADLLVDHLAAEGLSSLQSRFVISSGLPSHVSDLSGGGIFLVEDNTSSVEITKLYSGNAHGLIRGKEGDLYFNSQGDGLYKLNTETLSPQKLFGIPNGYRPHGIAEYGKGYLMVSSYQDSIIQVDNCGQILRTYEISNKKSKHGTAQHHCNDILVCEDCAYVSMFSVSGNWKRGIFDGGVVEIDLSTGNTKTICQDLTMPHNINMFGGEFRVLNSFKGEILLNNFEVFGSLPGFARGLDEDEQYLYVGESKNRNFSRLDTNRTPVSIDTRITVIDKKVKCSKSIPLPSSISEIHSVVRIS